jgi:hypothetical protein
LAVSDGRPGQAIAATGATGVAAESPAPERSPQLH